MIFAELRAQSVPSDAPFVMNAFVHPFTSFLNQYFISIANATYDSWSM